MQSATKFVLDLSRSEKPVNGESLRSGKGESLTGASAACLAKDYSHANLQPSDLPE